jgi:hypothetical protein
MNRLFQVRRLESLLVLKLAHHFHRFLDSDLFVKNTFVSTIQFSMFAPLRRSPLVFASSARRGQGEILTSSARFVKPFF